MRKHNGMRPQDVAVLLKIVSVEETSWRYSDIAKGLQISQSEVAEVLGRCKTARLVDASKRKVYKASLLEFLLHGFKYVFPVEPGPIVRGIPTAQSAKPLSEQFASSQDIFVWPDEGGSVRGQSISPLYPKLPKAALNDTCLYEMLTLLDAIRLGRARLYHAAAESLTKYLNQKAYA